MGRMGAARENRYPLAKETKGGVRAEICKEGGGKVSGARRPRMSTQQQINARAAQNKKNGRRKGRGGNTALVEEGGGGKEVLALEKGGDDSRKQLVE